MRIDSSGRVGIGTASPTAILDLRTVAGTAATQNIYSGNNATASTLQFGQIGSVAWDTGITTGAGWYQIGINGSQTAYTIARNGSIVDYHVWLTNGNERMRIDSSGNVGIGTTSPSTYGKFVVSGGNNVDVGVFIGNLSVFGSAPTYKGSIRIVDNPLGLSTNGGLEFMTSTFGSGYGWRVASIDSSGVHLTIQTRQNSASWTEVARFDSAGNLGLGVSPSAWAGIAAAIQLNDYGSVVSKGQNFWTGSNFYYNFGDKYATTAPATKYEQSGGAHKWFTAPPGTANAAISFTQAMTLDASGNLGVGTTSPSTWGKVVAFGGGHSLCAVNVLPLLAGRPNHIRLTTPNNANVHGQIGLVQNTSEGDHHLLIQSVEDGVAWRNVSLCRDGGNVGIGTSSPNTRLEINSTASYNPLIVSGKNNPFIYLTDSSATTNDSTDVTLQTFNGISTSGPYWSRINFNASGHIFKVYNVERARIDSSGKLLIGATSDVFGAATNFSVIRGDYTFQYGLVLATTQGSGNENYAQFANGTTNRGTIIWDTTASELRFSGKASGTYSDARLKTIKGKYSGGLDLTNRLSVYDINWKTSKQDDIVLVAQETISIAPHIVEVGKDGEIDLSNLEPEKVWRVDYSKLVPVLVSAIQELAAKVAELEAKI
jgi:hypothetical protein